MVEGKKHLTKALLVSTHNIRFCEEMRYFLISPWNYMLWYSLEYHNIQFHGEIRKYNYFWLKKRFIRSNDECIDLCLLMWKDSVTLFLSTWKECYWDTKKKESAKPSRNVLSRKPELKHHQQRCLPQTSLVLSAAGSLKLRLVSSAILEHTNSRHHAFD